MSSATNLTLSFEGSAPYTAPSKDAVDFSWLTITIQSAQIVDPSPDLALHPKRIIISWDVAPNPVTFQFNATPYDSSNETPLIISSGSYYFNHKAFNNQAFVVDAPPALYEGAFDVDTFQSGGFQDNISSSTLIIRPILIDQSVVYEQTARTREIFVPQANAIDQSTVEVPEAFNKTQIFTSAPAIDQSEVIAQSAFKYTQCPGVVNSTDQSQVYNPTNVYNLKQVFDSGTYTDQSIVYNPVKVFNLVQIVSPALIDGSSFIYTVKPGDLSYHSMTSFKNEVTGVVPTVYGNTYLSNGEAVFDGSGDYIFNAAFTLTDGDFTIESWFMLTGLPNLYGSIIGTAVSWSSANKPLYLTVYQNGHVAFGGYGVYGDGYNPLLESNISIPLNTWNHVAVVRSGSITTMYINGVANATSTNITPLRFSSGFRIGSNGWDGSNSYFKGRIDSVRIANVANYSGNFGPSRHPENYVLELRDIFNSQTVLTSALIDQSEFYLHGYLLTRQYAQATLIDQSNVYPITYELRIAIYQASDAIDQSEVYAPYAGNHIQYQSITTIDHSEVLTPVRVYNYRQNFAGATADDQSTVYTPTKVYNKTQINAGATAIDQSTVYTPTKVYNKTQIFVAVYTDSFEAYSPKIYALRQTVIGALIEANEIFAPAVDRLNRVFDAGLMFDQSEVYKPTLTRLNTSYSAATAIDQSTVYTPAKVFTLKQIVIPAATDQAASYSPKVDLEFIDIHPTTIDDGVIYAASKAEAVNRIFECGSVIDQSFFYPVDVSFYVRSFALPLIDAGEMYNPAGISNINQEIRPTLIDASAVYSLADVFNLNRTFTSATAIDQSEIYPLSGIVIMNQVAQGSAAIDQSSTYSPIVTTYYQAITLDTVDQSAFYAPALSMSPQADVAATAYSGESTSTPTLTTSANHLLFAFGYSGEYSYADATANPGYQLAAVGYDGEALSLLDLGETFPGLRAAVGYDGYTFTVAEIGNDVLITAYEGWSCPAVALITESILTPSAYTSEEFKVAIDTHPSEGIGTVKAYEGAAFFAGINVPYAGARLNPYPIPFISKCEADYYFPFELDLSMDCICDGPRSFTHTNIDIDFDNGEKLFDKFHGEAVYMHAVLSRQVFFSATAYAGEEAKFTPFKTFEPTVIYTEMNSGYASLNLEINRFQLCKGNFRPSGSNAPIEMFDALDSTCQEHYAYAGETMYIAGTLQCTAHMQALALEGDEDYVQLTILPPMQATMYAFNTISVELSTNSTFIAFAYEGNSSSVTFDTPFFKAYSGEYMMAAVVTDYSVEFTHSGSLSNEHVIQLPNGDVDLEKTTSVPMELYTYRHDLKARCF